MNRPPVIHFKRPLTFDTPAFHDESLSSWLVRASLRHGMNPLDFTKYYWTAKERLWTKDIDVTYPTTTFQDEIYSLSNASPPINFEQLFDAYRATLSLSRTYFISSISKRNRKSAYGQVFCPKCLEHDETAYLSLAWRLSPMLFCHIHECRLQDSCPHCQAPYEPNLLTYDKLSTYQPLFINRCSHCFKKVSDWDISINQDELLITVDVPLIKNAIVFEQDFYHATFSYQDARAFGETLDHIQYLELTTYLISFIRFTFRHKLQSVTLLLRKLRVPLGFLMDNQPLKGLNFGSLTLDERLPIILALPCLINTDKQAFTNLCLECGVNRSAFAFDSMTIPPSFMSIYESLIDNSRENKIEKEKVYKPKTYKQVVNRFALLKRKAYGVNGAKS